MLGGLKHIPFLVFLALLAAACSRDRVLSEKQMEDLYVDMFIADQWLRDHPQYRDKADSSLYYDPVFRKHSCTFRDYDASVRHYIGDPEKFADLTRRVSERLEKMSEEMSAIVAENAEIERTNEGNRIKHRFVDFTEERVTLDFYSRRDSTRQVSADTLTVPKERKSRERIVPSGNLEFGEPAEIKDLKEIER